MKNMLNNEPAAKIGNTPAKQAAPAPSKGKGSFGMQKQPQVGATPAGGQKSARTGPLPATPSQTVPAVAPRGKPGLQQSNGASKPTGSSGSGLDAAMSAHADRMHPANRGRAARTTGY